MPRTYSDMDVAFSPIANQWRHFRSRDINHPNQHFPKKKTTKKPPQNVEYFWRCTQNNTSSSARRAPRIARIKRLTFFSLRHPVLPFDNLFAT